VRERPSDTVPARSRQPFWRSKITYRGNKFSTTIQKTCTDSAKNQEKPGCPNQEFHNRPARQHRLGNFTSIALHLFIVLFD